MTSPARPAVTVRNARAEDVPVLLGLIRELAEYERLSHVVTATEEGLRESLFGDHPGAEVLLGEVGGRAEGYALFFPNYSTFRGRSGMYLEDLYVRPASRGLGLGRALLVRVAAIAAERGGGRLEWVVLDWNEPAIAFYEKLGARPLSDWTVFRLSGEALRAVAQGEGDNP